nr:MFS transporter [Actinopolymorpha cephalotaxi]
MVADLVSTAVFPLAITGSTGAIPAVAAALRGPGSLAPWIVTGYNGAFAATLLLAGAFADRSSRSRFFAAGNLLVAVTGLLSALAPNLAVLVGLRTLAGVGAAMCAAGGSSLVLSVYRGEERTRVYGLVGTVLGCATAAGPVATQALLAVVGWQAVFVGPAIVAAVAAAFTVGLPSLRTNESDGSFDLAGALLFGAAIATLVTGLGLGPRPFGLWWPPLAFGAVAVVTVAALTVVERRAARPVIPFDVLRVPAFRAYAYATGALMGVFVVSLTVLPQIAVAGRMSRWGQTTMLVLLTAPSVALPVLGARIARRWARALVMAALALCGLTGILLVPAHSQRSLLAGALVFGLCVGITEGVPDGQALRDVRHQSGGAAAAMFSTARMTLETLVLAAATGIMTAYGPRWSLVVPALVCVGGAVLLARTPIRR